MTTYHSYKVKLSEGQKKRLAKAYKTNTAITIRLTKNELSGSDEMMLTKRQINKLIKAKAFGKGSDIKISKTQIRKSIRYGGSLFTSLLSLGRAFAPTIAKTLGLSALSGLASEGASQVVKAISGKGIQTGGFLIPQNKIDQLIQYKHLLTKKQKEQILNSLQSGGKIFVKPTKKQSGGFLGTLLASIGIPLAIEAIKKITGNGAPKMGLPPKGGKGAPRIGLYRPPPFIGNWPSNSIGMGTKKKLQKKSQEKDYC